MVYKQIDYKGKYFILQDLDYEDEYGMYFEIGLINEERITDEFLRSHITNCNYYGIPAYIGKNKKLKSRIKKVETLLEIN